MGELLVQLAALSTIAWLSRATAWLPWLLTIAAALAAVQLYLFASGRVSGGAGGGAGGAPAMSTRRKLMLATWAAPSEPNVYGVVNVNAEPLKALIDAAKARGDRLTVTTLVAKAAALAFRYCPSLNSRLAFDTFIPKPTIDVSCLCNVDEGKDLALVTLTNADTKPLAALTAELSEKAKKLREHKDDDFNKSKPLLKALPVALLRPLIAATGYLASALGLNIPALGVKPFPGGTCMVTSVGAMGVESGFAPFTPFLRVPVLLLVGGVEKKAVVRTDPATGADSIVVQHMLSISGTIDHRFVDGAEIAKLGVHLKRLLETPELLDSPDATPTAPGYGPDKGADNKGGDKKSN